MYPTERTELLKHISVQWYIKKGESPKMFGENLAPFSEGTTSWVASWHEKKCYQSKYKHYPNQNSGSGFPSNRQR